MSGIGLAGCGIGLGEDRKVVSGKCDEWRGEGEGRARHERGHSLRLPIHLISGFGVELRVSFMNEKTPCTVPSTW
jgi:hypothetical protein